MASAEAKAKPKAKDGKDEDLDDMKKELEWDEHKISLDELAARFNTNLDKGK